MGVNWRGAGGYVSPTHLIPLCVMCSDGRVGVEGRGGKGDCVNPALDKQAVLKAAKTDRILHKPQYRDKKPVMETPKLKKLSETL